MTTQPPSHEEVQELAFRLECDGKDKSARTVRALLADNVRLSGELNEVVAMGRETETENDQLRERIGELEKNEEIVERRLSLALERIAALEKELKIKSNDPLQDEPK